MTFPWNLSTRTAPRDGVIPSPARLPRGPLLTIDWTDSSVTILHVLSTAGEMTLGDRLHLKWPEELNLPVHSTQAGVWLKTELRRHGLPLLPAVVCAPRRRGFVKLIEVPRVPQDMLIDLVQAQAEQKSGTEFGGVRVDFSSVASPDDNSKDLAPLLLAVLPTRVLQQVQSVLAAAEISIVSMGFGELAIPTLYGSLPGLTLGILCNHSKTELILSRAGHCLALHSIPSVTTDPAAENWLATAERMRATLPEQMQSEGLSSLAVGGPLAAEAAESLARVTSLPVERFGTSHESDLRSIAYLTSLQSPAHAVDFLSPRRADDPQAVRQRRIRQGLLWGGAVMAPLLAWSAMERSELDRELARLRREAHDHRAFVERGAPIVSAAGFLDDWDRSNTDWSRELARLLPVLPRGESGYLSRMSLQHREGEPAAAQFSGVARDVQDVTQLNSKIVRSDRYLLNPRAIEPNPLDDQFKVRFETDLVLRDEADEAAGAGDSAGGAQ